MDFSRDILQPMGKQQQLELLRILKNNQPLTLDVYCILRMFMQWDDSADDLISRGIFLPDKFKGSWFTHKEALPQNATFICITGEEDYMIYAFTLEESGEELKECLLKTKRIQWHLKPWIGPFRRPQNSHVMEEVVDELQLALIFENRCGFLKMDKQFAQNLEFNIPDGYQMRGLTSFDAEFINDVWPHKEPGSIRFVRGLIEINGGLGIYRQNDELVAWIIKNEYNGLGLLQVVKSEEGKGFGSIMIKALSKKIATEEDIDVNAFTTDHNTRSRGLLVHLGFTFIQLTSIFNICNKINVNN